MTLERGTKVADVPGYAEGAFIVQDPATALAVELMDVRPGERVLDACAAPGGKAIQLAWRGADVTACEVNPRRRRKLEENLQRVGLSGVEVANAIDANMTDNDSFNRQKIEWASAIRNIAYGRPSNV